MHLLETALFDKEIVAAFLKAPLVIGALVATIALRDKLA